MSPESMVSAVIPPVLGTPAKSTPDIGFIDDGEGNEVGPGLTFSDTRSLRQSIPNPNGEPGEVVPLDGRYKILFLESILDRLKNRMNTYMYTYLSVIAAITHMKTLTNDNELESVAISAFKAFQQGLDEARKNTSDSALTEDTKRANRMLVSSQLNKDDELDETTRQILEEVYTTTENGKKRDLSCLPPGTLSQMIPGLPELDFTSQEALIHWAIKTGKLDETLLKALVILFPETKKEQLSLNYLLNVDSSGFTVVAPKISGMANIAINWLKSELGTYEETPNAYQHQDGKWYFTRCTLTPENLAKVHTVKFATLVGYMIVEGNYLGGLGQSQDIVNIALEKLRDAKTDMLATLSDNVIVGMRTQSYSVKKAARDKQRDFDRLYPINALSSELWRR
jgi:hypothetical protein